MGKIRETQTLKKHQKMYSRFLEIRKSYGEIAKHISNTFFYDQIAEEYDCSTDQARRVCNKFAKSGRSI